ncbi:hypothetical protein BDB00DRAFT_168613 [Zychaea mexicana]|uniref:uncharacterized protein n=1 Tax=Zychaea mexicana TaxID=64656 RepID=UPI0022FED2DD|nr:uncharacterized protein BDB00DRAFT_168613 [Zychaea mexicana]KAI9482564.1 hypothetical protein BDB00DRAFT_168613 [Zychaea mexicana]
MDYETIVIPHKAESVTSTTSSTDQPPSLYSGSSICDADSPMMQEPDFPAIQIPHDDDQKAYFVDDYRKNSMISQCNHVTIPASPGPVYNPQPLLTKKRRASSTASSAEAGDDLEREEKRFKATVTTTPSLIIPTTTTSTSASTTTDSTSPSAIVPPNRELLTEEEKRANHIASEQKRRNTIRNGFKEMTELIPTLKNINNSKSTILFKAVEYIRHLEKRNRNMREKISALHMRVEVKRSMGTLNTSNNNNNNTNNNEVQWPAPSNTSGAGVTSMLSNHDAPATMPWLPL